MKLGISHTTLAEPGGGIPDPREVARHVEELGLDSIWVSDHLAWDTPILESMLALTAAAAVTSRIEVGFGVLQLALRQLAWAAKQLGTLQLISGRRLQLGVGVGGHPVEEWAAAGRSLGDRGRRTDEALAVLPGLLAGEPTPVPDVAGAPVALAPVAPMPPVWVGGDSGSALRRTARFGDGWLPAGVSARQLRSGQARLRELAGRYGRPVPRTGAAVFATLTDHLGGMSRAALVDLCTKSFGMPREHAEEVVVSGRPEEVAERLAGYRAAGVAHVVVVPFGGSWRQDCDLLAQARALT